MVADEDGRLIGAPDDGLGRMILELT